MKQAKLLFMTLALGLGIAGSGATEVTPYTVNFDTEINTEVHNFRVSKGWLHQAEPSYGEDWYGDSVELWMTYSYVSWSGYEGTGALSVGDYYAYGSGASAYVKDYLITPMIKGDVKMMVNPGSSYGPFIEIYGVKDDETVDTDKLIKRIDFDNGLTQAYEWGTVTLLTSEETGTEYKRYALRISNMKIDNFTADSANLLPEKILEFASVSPDDTTGTGYWNQQPNGKVKVEFQVSVKNTGDLTLTTGDDNYSITVWEGKNNTDLFTVNVPQTLEPGATSDVFTVSGEVDPEVWGGTYANVKMNLRENVSRNEKRLRDTRYNAYQPKFVMREPGSTSTSTYSTPVVYGLVQETKTKAFELYNDGPAPLQIKSMTLPAGFSGLPEQTAFTLNYGESKPFSVTLEPTIPGSYSGNLEIVYVDGTGKDVTYTLAVSGTVVSADCWTWEFGNERDLYPEGSIVTSGITTDWSSSFGSYNYYLEMNSTSYSADFILPKLSFAAGEKLTFDAAYSGYSGDGFGIKVYVSTDRSNWGEPSLTLGTEDVTSNSTYTPCELTVSEAGDYFVRFEMQAARIDNIVAPALADIAYDLYIKGVTEPGEKQAGGEISVDITTLATKTMAAADYTVRYRTDNEVLAEAESKDLTADAKKEVSFNVKFTPEVTATTVYNAYVEVEFADGSTITTAPIPFTITYQPEFVFNTPGIQDSQWWKPSSRTAPISFGMVNETGLTQEYEIFNWGAAPLTISSITVPEGFTVTPASAEIEAKGHQAVYITLSATEAGLYSGNLTISYTELDGDKTFELPINATLLDPTKWLGEFVTDPADSYGSTMLWPAGTIHGSNVNSYNAGTYYEPMWSAKSNSTTDNMLISPKLKATEGEKLAINAKLYTFAYTEGSVKVYTSETREGLEKEDSRTLVATLLGKEGGTHLVTEDWNVYEVAMPEGEYYVGFEFTNQLCVNYFYGLELAETGIDLSGRGATAPASAMQNNLASYTMDVVNFSPTPVAADAYTVTVKINGEEAAVSTQNAEIPTANTYDTTPTSITVSARYPKVGTFPMTMVLTSGDFRYETEPVNVTITPEVFSASKQIGEIKNSSSNDAPIKFYNNNSESVMLYTASQLDLSAGDKISAIAFKGMHSKNINSKLNISYAWVDAATLAQPQEGRYDRSSMTTLLSNDSYAWSSVGSSSETAKVLDLVFATPETYEAGKSLLICVSSEADDWVSNSQYGWEVSSILDQCYYIASDGSIATSGWVNGNLPVLYLSLAKEPVAVSGNVTAGGEAVEGATVTFISTDGDNVQYESTTDAEGNYTVDLIQNGREYEAVASYEKKIDFADATIYTANGTLNFDLIDYVEIKDADFTEMHQASENAHVKVNLQVAAGFNSIVLPFDLTKEEVEELFGANAEVLKFGNSHLDDFGNLTLYFESLENKAMEAGVPYLLKSENDGFNTIFKGKAVSVAYNHLNDLSENVEFRGTYEPVDVDQNMYVLSDDMFVPSQPAARSVEKISPYSAYVYAVNPEVHNINFTIDNLNATAVEDLDIDQLDDNAVIYNLQGLRVYNPGTGIYIVNGKKVMLK